MWCVPEHDARTSCIITTGPLQICFLRAWGRGIADEVCRIAVLLGPLLVVIPSVARMSEDIRRVCRKFNIRVVFKSGWTLRSMLTKVWVGQKRC